MREVYYEATAVMQVAIDKLLKNYEGFGGSQIDNNEKPQHEINHFLEQLDIYYPDATKRRLKLAIRQFITRLSCFKYRVLAKSDNNKIVAVWNPLEESLQQFLAQYNQHNIIYQSNKDSYPTSDIISGWVTSHINEDMAAD